MARLSFEELSNLSPSTRFVHGGQEPDRAFGAVVPPIYLSSTFHQPELGKNLGYEYSRTANPTRDALEEQLALAEKGRFGFAFASGSAATNTVLNLLEAGDHVVAGDDLYGGTYRLFEQAWRKLGLTFTYVDPSDPERVRAALTEKTRLVWLETPTNPLLGICDLRAICELIPDGVLVAVDNTFASPYLQNPLELGAHLVVHSTTKYIGGHSDLVGGAIVVNDPELAERIHFFQNAVGAVPSPFDCYLASRGLKTLALRMERHSKNAQAVAEFLAGHPMVERVYYPGLPSHPGHEVAKAQMKHGFSGMVSFSLRSEEAARRLVRKLRIFLLAESLGGVESLVCHPATMTHASYPREEREARGITDRLLRLSVGIEDPEDLIADLGQALEKAAG